MANGIILWLITVFYICCYCLISVETFGYNNRYTCHCNNNRCDVNTGRCINGAPCQQGWYGSTCQKENVALNKTTYSNTQYEHRVSSYAVDGDTTHHKEDLKCFHAGVYTPGTPNYWQVDLQQRYPIRDIKIYLRDTREDRLRGFYINTDNSINAGTACRPPANNITGSVCTIHVKCEGRYLRFSNTNLHNPYAHVNLCEVEVYVCSPGTYGPDCTLYCYCKSHTDRCTDGVCPNGCASGYTGDSCNTTCDIGMYYGVNCSKLCSERECFNRESSCDQFNGTCNNTECNQGYTGDDCTQACDIGVNYGVNCSKLCSDRECFNKESSCDQFNGTCDKNGCNQGYTGDDCTQACDIGVHYGVNCSKLCSDRECFNNESSCDQFNGTCNNTECNTGYKGDDCTQECDRNTNYGDQCLKKCSDRKCSYKPSSCDHITGACYNQQCKAGYQGVDCYQECHSDYYGDKCSKNCSIRNCLNTSSTCDHIIGKCEGGCIKNKQGVDCTQDCSVGFYGDRCIMQCAARKCKPHSDLCQTTNGSCATGCVPGYLGFDCTKPCSSGFYGDGCNQTCKSRKCKIFSNTCNHEAGSCGVDGCLPGYQLKDCSKQCTGRSYGLGCTLNCDDRNCENNTICDISIGKCGGSCTQGFKLDDCTQKIRQEEPIGAIVGSVLTVVVAGSIVIIVVIVVLRRRAARLKSNVADNYTLPTRNLDDHLYNDAEIVYEDIDSAVDDDGINNITHLADKPTNPTSNSQAKSTGLSKNTSSVKPTAPVPDTPSGYYYNLPPAKPRLNTVEAMDKIKTMSNVVIASSHEQDTIMTDFSAKYDVELKDVRQKMKIKAVLFEKLGVQSTSDLDFVEATDLSDVLTLIQLRRFTTIKMQDQP